MNKLSPISSSQSTNYKDGADSQDFLDGLKLVLIKSQSVTCLVTQRVLFYLYPCKDPLVYGMNTYNKNNYKQTLNVTFLKLKKINVCVIFNANTRLCELYSQQFKSKF